MHDIKSMLSYSTNKKRGLARRCLLAKGLRGATASLHVHYTTKRRITSYLYKPKSGDSTEAIEVRQLFPKPNIISSIYAVISDFHCYYGTQAKNFIKLHFVTEWSVRNSYAQKHHANVPKPVK